MRVPPTLTRLSINLPTNQLLHNVLIATNLDILKKAEKFKDSKDAKLQTKLVNVCSSIDSLIGIIISGYTLQALIDSGS